MKNKLSFINAYKIRVAKNGNLLIFLNNSAVISLHPNYVLKILESANTKPPSDEQASQELVVMNSLPKLRKLLWVKIYYYSCSKTGILSKKKIFVYDDLSIETKQLQEFL